MSEVLCTGEESNEECREAHSGSHVSMGVFSVKKQLELKKSVIGRIQGLGTFTLRIESEFTIGIVVLNQQARFIFYFLFCS